MRQASFPPCSHLSHDGYGCVGYRHGFLHKWARVGRPAGPTSNTGGSRARRRPNNGGRAGPTYKSTICKLAGAGPTYKSTICKVARAWPTYKLSMCKLALAGLTYKSAICKLAWPGQLTNRRFVSGPGSGDPPAQRATRGARRTKAPDGPRPQTHQGHSPTKALDGPRP